MEKQKYIKEAIVWNCYVGKNGAWVRISDLNYVEEEDKYYPTFTGRTKIIISEAYPYEDWMEEYIGTNKELTKDERFKNQHTKKFDIEELKKWLVEHGCYVGNSEVAKSLRELADYWDD